MRKTIIVIAIAVILSALMALSCFGASDIQTGSAQSFWGNLSGIYTAFGFGAGVAGSNLVELTSTHWVMGSDLDVPDSIQSELYQAGYFNTPGSTLSATGSLAFSSSVSTFYVIFEKPIMLQPGQKLEFYVYNGFFNLSNSSVTRNLRYIDKAYMALTQSSGLPSEPVTYLESTITKYDVGSGSDLQTEYFRFECENISTSAYTVDCFVMRYHTTVGGSSDPVPPGSYTISFRASFSNILTYSGDVNSIPAPDPILNEINQKIDEQIAEQKKQSEVLNGIKDALVNNPYGEITLPPDQEDPEDIINESQALGEFDDLLNDWDDFYDTFPLGLPAFWKTIIDTLFNLGIFAPFIICGVLFLIIRAVMGR